MKYIIEIEDEPFESDGKMLYRAIGFRPYDESEAERQGAEKAWGIARKIMISVGDGGMTVSEIEECFDCDDIAKLSYQEVAEKYEAWTNRRDEIRVGDEIENFAMNHEKGIVIEIDEKRARGFNLAGRYYFNWNVKEVHKTGRHFAEIGKFMRKMREAE
jgi:hypothetical protein